MLLKRNIQLITEQKTCESTILRLYDHPDRVAQQYAMYQSRAVRKVTKDDKTQTDFTHEEPKTEPLISCAQDGTKCTEWIDAFYEADIEESVETWTL